MPSDKEFPCLEIFEAGEGGAKYLLRLYIAGHTPRSMRAVENLNRIVAKYLPSETEVEVVDIYQQGQLAREANVIGAPTLIKRSPLPLRRLVGDLSDESKVLLGLNISAPEP
jgi:circadian clock protein KaiB